MIFKNNLFIQKTGKISEFEHSMGPVAFGPHKNIWIPAPSVEGNIIAVGLIKSQEVSVFAIKSENNFGKFFFSSIQIRRELVKFSSIKKLFPVIQRSALLIKSVHLVATLASALGNVGDVCYKASKRCINFPNQSKSIKKLLDSFKFTGIIQAHFGCWNIKSQRFEQRLKSSSEHVMPKQRKENRVDIHDWQKKLGQT